MSPLSSATRTGFKRAIGILLIVLGIIGLILPFIPGIPIIYIGLELLGLGLVVRSSVERALRRAGVEEMPHRRWFPKKEMRIHDAQVANSSVDKDPDTSV